MLHNCEQRGEDVVICNPGPPAGGFPIRQSMRPVGVCVYVGERGRGRSWENKCDESMWIIICTGEETYG